MISSFTTKSLKEEVGSGSGWSWISEPVGISKDDSFSKFGLLEQINTTTDKSDYLWYSLSIGIEDDAGSQTVLHIDNKAKVAVDIPIKLVTGKNIIDLLSLTMGLQNYGAFFDTWGAGITGPVY
ncbi:beta-galactosidase [Vigna unguiculata]|uniref:Beta-galactosidase n=1 Tax=Vigna unguiculata TaxID=3917 RepID=A0A4D6M8G0_VIGUN|nr:beta-galactosidase [Vigna unguiculata]